MCPYKGEYYFTGIASLCKFKNLIGRRWQCLQKSSHFVSVAWHRLWIEEKVGMKVSIKLHTSSSRGSLRMQNRPRG